MSLTSVYLSLFGGVLIGLAAILLLAATGRIAGISGMVGGFIRSHYKTNGWRGFFLAGLLAAGLTAQLFGVNVYEPLAQHSLGVLILGGLLVGLGTQMGSGCTSGHGVCGIGRFSLRSIWATITFMTTGIITVFIMNRLGNL